MASFKLYCAVLACVAIAAPMTMKADIQCNTVTLTLAPCLDFLRNGGKPTGPCCQGVQTVYKQADSTAARQQTCFCLKNDIKTIPAIKPENAAALPGDCNVKLPFNISANTDCTKVNRRQFYQEKY